MSNSNGSAPTGLARGRAPYELTTPLDGTSSAVRENLTDILRRELLGPSDGDTEVISVPPDSRYLLGRIAPMKLEDSKEPISSETSDGRAENEDAGAAELGDDLDARESRGVPQVSGDDSAIDADEDTGGDRDDEGVKRGLMIPASMGLRFQVPADLDEFTVIVEWGEYNGTRTGEVTATGREIRAFARTPVSHRVTIRSTDLAPGDTKAYPLQGDVLLRVDTSLDDNRRIVELALCNDLITPRKIPVNAWLFQTQLYVEADGTAAFLPVVDARTDTRWEPDPEVRRLRLQYQDRLEFAIGRTCSAEWTVAPGARRATQVRTTWLPQTEIPQVRAVEVEGAELDMRVLATASADEIEQGLRPIVAAYSEWLGRRQTDAKELPEHLRADGLELVDEAQQVCKQLEDGLSFLVGDQTALQCFHFMNTVMADQRVHTQVADLRAEHPELSLAAAVRQIEDQQRDDPAKPPPHSWRTFQLAFVLMQLQALCDPATARRSSDAANVELLFFPTGGGKTEAYLGLAAFTFAIRRLQGVVETPDGPLDGGSGVAVLMRYTLRLLTSQQFERASALVCAAELQRAQHPEVWGTEPFRIGLWVGTNVSPKRVDEANRELEKFNSRKGGGHRLTLLQVERCPWCGTKINPASIRIDDTERRVRIRCSDELGDCPFSEGAQIKDGLPMLTVDEEIYRLAPAFIIATVDKFARLAREGEAASLFGYVSQRCDRHGYVHPDYPHCDIQDGSKHPARGGYTAAARRPVARLRPPDLIIQDELHLITGALGTTVGLFEVAIDVLCTWRDASGERVRPLIVASSATVRNAQDQVRGLYGRGVTMFPPPALDVANSFFAKEEPISPKSPGRRYVGVSTTGVRLTRAEIRVAEVLMAGAQELLERAGNAADPYMTLVGYFNSTRELAGMTRYLHDDVQNALAKGLPGTNLTRRYGRSPDGLHRAELTGRKSSDDIRANLAGLKVRFDARYDTAVGYAALKAEHSDAIPRRPVRPFDAVLATSMLQVGVDVSRLGLMLMVGQPKSTAEYIQASSRVGRDADRPGLVVTIGNWARPRDLAHYESFRHYHETFYAQVEPLSVTPFSVTSMERGLDGLLVSAARVLAAPLRTDGLSPERQAGRVKDQRAFLEELIDRLVERIRLAGDSSVGAAEHASERLASRLGLWEKRRTSLLGKANLSYERAFNSKSGTWEPLIRSAESVRSRRSAADGAPFVVANSMREVQPEINILVSPKEEYLIYDEPVSAPTWKGRG